MPAQTREPESCRAPLREREGNRSATGFFITARNYGSIRRLPIAAPPVAWDARRPVALSRDWRHLL